MLNKESHFLPCSAKEVIQLGWDYVDVVLITGDAYIDHPSFGISVIARVLENCGYNVAVIPQPNWRDDFRDFKRFGEPRLFFGVSSGNMDSMVNHYTANKRLRSNDAYTPGGKSNFRPDYAVNVYSNILKSIYPDVPIVLGGIEASMRRFAHYDYWQDKVLTSILESSNADIISYGMGEKTIVEIANTINFKNNIYDCFKLNQIAYLSNNKDIRTDDVNLFSFSEISDDTSIASKEKYADNFVTIEKYSNLLSNIRITQELENSKLIVNPPHPPISEKELDDVYSLPFTRKVHPRYFQKPDIPAFNMIKDSVTIHRGCFGGCSFCTISAHQGKTIVSRSEDSILSELKTISDGPDFKGHISDIGGPSANMYKMISKNKAICEKCSKASCIYPKICPNLQSSHISLLNLYKKVLSIKNIKHITIGSGIRYDLILNENCTKEEKQVNNEYLELLVTKFVSGRLKVAPEHYSPNVLKLIRKPDFNLFQKFDKIFKEINKKYKLKQQLIPYFISAHPGCGMKEMNELADFTKKMGYKLEQVQTFTPTPMTLSTTMYYTEINPYTKEKIFVEKRDDKRKKQHKKFF